MPDRTVAEAKAAALEWVGKRSRGLPEFVGAYLCGSVCVRADHDTFSATSDADIRIVVDCAVPDPFFFPRHPLAQRKFEFNGIIMDSVYLSLDLLRDPQTVVADRFLAPPLAHACILSDPRDVLLPLHRAVASEFPKRRWIRARCQQARESVLAYCQQAGMAPPVAVNDPTSLSAAFVFIFALINAALIPMVAALQEPTTRKALVNASEILRKYGWGHLAECFVQLLGSANVTRSQVDSELAELERIFDRAVEVLHTPFYGDFDVSRLMRGVAIDGARELTREHHREAMHWILFNRIIAQSALMNDAPLDEREQHSADFKNLLMILGISSREDLLARADDIKKSLPGLIEAAEDIITRNPSAVD